MDFQFSVVFDETQFAEFVHEKAHARSGRADHLRQRFLTELSHDRLRPAFLAEIRKQKEKSGEALFARIEQLVDQVLFNSTVPSQQIRHEQFRKLSERSAVANWGNEHAVAFYRLITTGNVQSPDLLPDSALIAPVFPELAGNFSSMRSSRLRG